MKRLSVLCLVVAGMLYSASAFASVCFLADTACQQGQYQVDDRRPCLEQNSNLIYEGKRCMGLIYGGVVCNDSTGNYFEEGSCPAGYVDFSTVDQDKYECGNSLLCDRCCNDVRCKSKFKKCENNSVPANTNPDNTCQETWSDNSIKYTECICQNPYNQTCDGKGVTTSGNYCIDSNGKTFWSACQCDTGYFETLYANIKCPSSCTYGCLNIGTYTTLPGTSNYCWSGAECAPEPEKLAETCKIVYQSDFDNFWEGYDVATKCRNLTVNCAVLGYDTGKADIGVMCKDGTEPYRCPFDHTAVYCESGIEDSGCQYTTQSTCEMSYFGSTCTPDSKGCWNPNACKDGYGKTKAQCSSSENGNWSLGSSDEFGCAQCNKKECPTIKVKYPVYGSSSGSAAYTYRNVQATTNSSEAACGTLASKGWSTVLTGSYSGDDACWVCEPKFCPVGYSTDKTSIADCGDSSLWSFNLASTAAGDDLCGKCTLKTTTCPSGYTAGLTNVSKCGSSGAKGWTLKTQGNCGKCVAKECTQGQTKGYYNTIVDGVSLLYQQYFIFTENSYYSGDSKCGKFSLNKQMWCEDYKSSLIHVCTTNQSGSGTLYWFGYAYEEYKERELGLSDDIFKYCSEYPTDKYCNLSDKTGYGYDLNACISEVKNNFSQYGTKYDFCSECGTPIGSIESPINMYYCQNWGDY